MIGNTTDLLLAVLAVWMALASLVAFAAFGIDKRAALKGKRRIPEARLHLMELIGGWPGAVLGAFVFRHKIRKPRYLLVLMLSIAAWLVAAWFVTAFISGGEKN